MGSLSSCLLYADTTLISVMSQVPILLDSHLGLLVE